MPEESALEFMARKNRAFKADREAPIRMKDIGRRGSHAFEREAWTFMPQSNLADEKVFIVERLRRVRLDGDITHQGLRVGDVEYRIGYYMRGKIRKASGRWVWGQFCPMVPADDLPRLLDKARREGTLLPY